jgi:hypothetical protein
MDERLARRPTRRRHLFDEPIAVDDDVVRHHEANVGVVRPLPVVLPTVRDQRHVGETDEPDLNRAAQDVGIDAN